MKSLWRQRKTVGSLLAVIAFLLQWTVVDALNSRVLAAYPGDQFGLSEIKQNSLEILYFETRDPAYLSDSLQSAVGRFTILQSSQAFYDSTKEARFKAISLINTQPKTWEEYTRSKRALMKAMGATYDEWSQGTLSLEKQATAARAFNFALSLIGLLLVWSAETFPSDKKKRSTTN